MPLIIGVDESGKGDFFGPLVVAALLAPDERIPDLVKLGVRDSKKLTDKRMAQIDTELRNQYPSSLYVLLPTDYNQLYLKIRNLNILLAKGHARVIHDLALSHPADLAISDKFGKTELIEKELALLGCEIQLRQEVRGEAIPQVAAASILARARFVSEMHKLSEAAGLELPKGAGDVVDRAGRALVMRYGKQVLEQYAKIHFKNYQRANQLKLL